MPANPPGGLRGEIKRGLATCAGYRNPQFRERDIDHLVHGLEQLQREPWTKEAMQSWRARLKAIQVDKAKLVAALGILQPRASQATITEMLAFIAACDADIALLRGFLGHGTRPREPWSIMAEIIGNLTLEALRGAQQLAGREPRRGFGAVDGRIISFIYQQLTRICATTGETPPSREALHDLLSGKA